jgi:hypothetical protein
MLKRFILWDYPRGSRQYDVMVGIILAFIFFTPRDFFRDQPRIPKASNITMLPSKNGSLEFFVGAADLAKIPESARAATLTDLVQTRMSDRHLYVTKVEPILDSEGELQGYMAFASH